MGSVTAVKPSTIKTLASVALAAMAGTASAQIQLPNKVSPYEPIVAVCNCTNEEGTTVETKWDLTSRGNAKSQMIQVSGRRVHIWGSPGRHQLNVMWVVFREIEVVTPGGGTDKIKTVVSWDRDDHEFTISGDPGPDPDPDPDPDPVPEGDRWVIILEETEERTPQQADLWTDLRVHVRPKDDIELFISDHDRQSSWLPVYEKARKDKNQALPCMFIVDQKTRNLLWLGDAPKSVAEFDQLMKDHG